jgi:hypothetical protein
MALAFRELGKTCVMLVQVPRFVVEVAIYVVEPVQGAAMIIPVANPLPINWPPRINMKKQTYLRSAPSQPERCLVRKQLPKPEHEPVDEWQEQVDRRAPCQAPERRRRV